MKELLERARSILFHVDLYTANDTSILIKDIEAELAKPDPEPLSDGDFMSDVERLFRESAGKDLDDGVFSIHRIEVERLHRLSVADEIINTCAMLAVLMQDINDSPSHALELLCAAMAKAEKRIKALTPTTKPQNRPKQ